MTTPLKSLVVSMFVSIALLHGSATAQADTKSGYIDGDVVLASLPDSQKAEVQLKALESTLAKQRDAQSKKIAKIYADATAQAQAGKLSPAAEKQATTAVQKGEQLLADMVASAPRMLADKRRELFTPLFDKINEAIAVVAKEKGYSFIFEKNTMRYADPTTDITQVVLAKFKAAPVAK
jgi:outer membrane protein